MDIDAFEQHECLLHQPPAIGDRKRPAPPQEFLQQDGAAERQMRVVPGACGAARSRAAREALALMRLRSATDFGGAVDDAQVGHGSSFPPDQARRPYYPFWRGTRR